MAAYLVGRHGSLRQATLVATTVTATHTTGVLLLGVLVSSSAVIAPERLYPWLGALSGVLLVAVGIAMLRGVQRRRSAARAHEHAHAHGHHHDHDHGHSHGGRWHTHAPPARMDRTGLLAMGFVGGLLPSPSALVVLLGAIALGRAWFGVVLVVAYGAGMALTLTAIGLLLVRGREAIGRRLPRLLALESVMPVATGTVVLAVGGFLAVRGLVAI
jgi:ABC-type nickel/cobalt efflux system permease component RcnA